MNVSKLLFYYFLSKDVVFFSRIERKHFMHLIFAEDPVVIFFFLFFVNLNLKMLFFKQK